MPHPDAETTAQKFGRYRILEHLAKGGMAQIYKAETPNNKVFTLKKILSDFSSNPEFIKMFLEEAKISLKLKSPHIVRVLDFGQYEGVYFLAMEYVFGRDIGTLLRTCVEKRVYIPIDVACFIAYQCARGLDYAHSFVDDFGRASVIIHRDISPPNILLSYNGESKILDFGIAKAQRSTNRRNTRSGVLKGKFSYMSPEQASGLPLTGSSDLFSLGIVLHELLTCQSLFYSKDEMETLERVRGAKVDSPRKSRPEIPVALDKIVMKSLAKKPRSRFKGCKEFADALRDFLKENYPKTDSRTVARFVRAIFPEDFQKRSHQARNEGWMDVLVSGGADEDLLLDRSIFEEGALRQPHRTQSDELSTWQKALYDPQINSKIKVILHHFLIGFLIVGLVALGWSTGVIQKIPATAENWTLEALKTVRPGDSTSNTPQGSTSNQGSAKVSKAPEGSIPFGGFAYWKDAADKAEAEERWEDADLALKRAIEINPFESSLIARKAFVQIHQGNLDSSCQFFQVNTEVQPADKLLAIAICAEGQGDFFKAASGYQDFLKRFPNDSRASKVSWALKHLKAKIQE